MSDRSQNSAVVYWAGEDLTGKGHKSTFWGDKKYFITVYNCPNTST